MPAFFIISGMASACGRPQEPGVFLRRKVCGLLLPYFFLNLYAAPLRKWLEYLGENNAQNTWDLLRGVLISNADSGWKMASNTTWFLPCLFLTCVIFYFLRRLSRSEGMLILMTAAVTAAAAVLGVTHGGGGIWHWKPAVMALPFYLAGYLFIRHLPQIEAAFRGRRAALAAAAAAALLLAGYFCGQANGFVSMIRNQYHNLFLYYASALATSFAITLLVMAASRSEAFRRAMKPAERIGRRTLPYIAVHVPIMKLIKYYFGIYEGCSEWIIVLLSVSLYFGLLPLADLLQKVIPTSLPSLPSRQQLAARAGFLLRRVRALRPTPRHSVRRLFAQSSSARPARARLAIYTRAIIIKETASKRPQTGMLPAADAGETTYVQNDWHYRGNGAGRDRRSLRSHRSSDRCRGRPASHSDSD